MVEIDDAEPMERVNEREEDEQEEKADEDDPLARIGEAFLDSFDDGIRPTKIISKSVLSTGVIKKKKKKNKSLPASTACISESPCSPSTSSFSKTKRKKNRQSVEVEDELDFFNAIKPDKSERVSTSEGTTTTTATKAGKEPRGNKDGKEMKDPAMKRKGKSVDATAEKRETKEKELSQFLQHKKEFNEAIQEINKFVKPRLNKKQKKFYDEQKILALGGSLKKQQKCPYRIRKEEDANREVKRKKKIEADRCLGISTSLSGSHHMRRQEAMTRKKKEEKSKNERRQGHINLGLNVGRLEKGMLTVNKSYMGKYK